MTEEAKPCFVIACIGSPDSEEWKRTDKVFRHIIQPAVQGCGYKPERADQIQEPGIITRQIIDRLREVPLVVADLTFYNPNVFYELVIRHAVRKPLVQLIQQGHRIPFDVAPVRTIQVDYPDPDGIQKAQAHLVEQIKAVEKDSSLVDNPIADAIDLKEMRESGKPPEMLIAKLLEAFTELRGEFAALRRVVLARGSREPFSPLDSWASGALGLPAVAAAPTGSRVISPPPLPLLQSIKSAEEDEPK